MTFHKSHTIARTIVILTLFSFLCTSLFSNIIFRTEHKRVKKEKFINVPLSTLLKSPDKYKDTFIEFTCRFYQLGSIENPFHTQFVETDYINMHVWHDKVYLWKEKGIKSVFPLLFVKKVDTKTTTQVKNFKKYQRLSVQAYVAGIYKGIPWLEIRSVKTLGKPDITDKYLYHMRLAEKYNTEKKYNLAVNEYLISLKYELPEYEVYEASFRLGVAYFKNKSFDKAVQAFTNTIKINPAYGMAWKWLAKANYEIKSYTNAIAAAEKALSINPGDFEAHLMLGIASAYIGKYTIAEYECRKAWRINPDDIRNYHFLGIIYDLQGKYRTSITMYEKAIEKPSGASMFILHKNKAHGLLKLAKVQKKKNENEKAQESLELAHREFKATVEEINDKDPETFYLWGQTLRGMKDYENALVKLDKASFLKPDYVASFVLQGQIYEDDLGQLNKAVQEYENALKVEPENITFLCKIGYLYDKLQNVEKALKAYRNVLEISPEHTNANFQVGYYLRNFYNKHAKAIEHFNIVLKNDSKHKRALFNKGACLVKLQKYSEAVTCLVKYTDLDKTNYMVYYLLGDSYFQEGYSDKAIRAYKNALKINPADFPSMNNLAYTYAEEETNLDDALKLSVEALENNADSFTYMDTVGWVYYKRGEYEKALEMLQKSFNASGGVPVVGYHLALTYTALGKYSDALELSTLLEKKCKDRNLAYKAEKLSRNIRRLMKDNKKAAPKVRTPSKKTKKKADKPGRKPKKKIHTKVERTGKRNSRTEQRTGGLIEGEVKRQEGKR